MRTFIICLISCCFIIAGCNITPGNTAKTDSGGFGLTKKDPESKVEYGLPVPIDSSTYVMYPLSGKDAEKGSDGGSFSYGGSLRTYWNIVFYDFATKKYHLLDSTRKMVINSYGGGGSSATDGPSEINVIPELTKQYLFYGITINDLNKDGVLDDSDPQYLFISDREGNNFKQISPDNMEVYNWEIISKTGQLLFVARGDTNNDKKYDGDDISISYRYDLINGGKAEPVFSDGFNERVNELFKKQWPAKK